MDRVTADARSGHHWHVGSQMFDEVHHRLVDVFLWQLFPDGSVGRLQLISRLRLRMVLFQYGVQDVIVQRVKISGEFQ